MTYSIKQHDLEPPLTINAADGVATFNVVESWRVLIRVGSTVYEDTSPTVVLSDGNTNAAVTHEWVDGETDDAVVQAFAEAEATWPGGRKQTFPPNEYLKFPIHKDLG